jgi:hypothetical protein
LSIENIITKPILLNCKREKTGCKLVIAEPTEPGKLTGVASKSKDVMVANKPATNPKATLPTPIKTKIISYNTTPIL